MGTITLRKLTRADGVEIKITIEAEEIDYRDQFDDPRDVAIIADRLARGEVEAWCCVTVEARWNGLKGYAHLGGCSLEAAVGTASREPLYTPLACAQEHGMLDEALDDLNATLASMATTIAPLVTATATAG